MKKQKRAKNNNSKNDDGFVKLAFESLNTFPIPDLISMISGRTVYTGYGWEFSISFDILGSDIKFSDDNLDLLYQCKNILYAMTVKFFPLIEGYIRNNREFKIIEDPKYSASKFWKFLSHLATIYETELPDEWKLYIEVSQN